MQTITYIVEAIGSDCFALLFALLVPWIIIYSCHEIRFRRLRLIMDYEVSFASKAEKRLDTNPTFEFVKSKYISDIKASEFPKLEDVADMPIEANETDRKIAALLQNPPRFFALGTNWRLLCAATGFAILTFFGFAVSLSNLTCIAAGGNCASPLHNLVFVGGLGVSDADSQRYAEQILTVASLAFLGGYISAIREFLRRMALFDLSSYTFLKQAAEILASVLAVVFLYRAFPDPVEQVKASVAGTWAVPKSIPFLWLAIAPLFGLFPESATRYLFVRSRSIFNWIKSEDNRFAEVTRSTPLDVIDGIDYWTRIRLEQCGIFDVQNLATYNPIMLYIETPYGIYQVFDWTAQAQLCHIVGLEKFLMLREINVRTIFDLERGVRSSKSPDQYDDIFAAILFAPTSSMKTASTIAEMKFVIREENAPKLVDYQAYCVWIRGRIGADDVINSSAIEHLISWITDDLHVRRLRRLWADISISLGPSSIALPDDKDLLTDKDPQEDAISVDTPKDGQGATPGPVQTEPPVPDPGDGAGQLKTP